MEFPVAPPQRVMICCGTTLSVDSTLHAYLIAQVKTLPKALQTQALTALTSSYGLVWWVWFGGFGLVALVGLVRFGLVWYVWFGMFSLLGFVW